MNTHVRVVQVVSDAASGVNIQANGTTVVSGLGFGGITPSQLLVQRGGALYQSLAAGTQFAFTAVGSATPFYNQVPSAAAAGAYITIVAYGRATQAGATGATIAAVPDTSVFSTSSILIRLFNTVDYLTDGVGSPVDVYVYSDGSSRPTTPDASGLAWGARTAYLSKPAGTLRIDVFRAGAASTGTPLFTGTVAGDATSIRTVVLTDPPASNRAAGGSLTSLYDYN